MEIKIKQLHRIVFKCLPTPEYAGFFDSQCGVVDIRLYADSAGDAQYVAKTIFASLPFAQVGDLIYRGSSFPSESSYGKVALEALTRDGFSISYFSLKEGDEKGFWEDGFLKGI